MMPARPSSHLYLVRHGQTQAGARREDDPGLGPDGRRQALAAADRLKSGCGPFAPVILTSPLRRAVETGALIAEALGLATQVDPRLAEAPDVGLVGANVAEAARIRDWSEADETLLGWRRGLRELAGSVPPNTILVSHFLALNAIAGWGRGDDRVIVFEPEHGSVVDMEVLLN